MTKQEDKNKTAPQQEASSSRKPFDAQSFKETSSVQRWADAVKISSRKAARLRQEVVHFYSGVPLHTHGQRLYTYAQEHSWSALEPYLTEAAASIPLYSVTPAQRELLGFAKLVDQTLPEDQKRGTKPFPPGVKVDVREYISRLEFREDFADSADWLASLAQITWVKGSQLEAEAKATAQLNNVYAFAQLRKNIESSDLREAYSRTIKIIRPTAKRLTPFIVGDNDVSKTIFDTTQNRELKKYLSRSYMGRPGALERFLKEYNRVIHESSSYMALAWIYGTYRSMHPHPDYNGTMARTLVDYYIHKKGLRAIDWLAVLSAINILRKELDLAWEAYALDGNTQPLNAWFMSHIGGF